MVDRYAHLREFYADFARHDDEARIVAWRCRDDQILRLEVLLEAIDDADWPLSVLDVGCGLGALYEHLEATGRLGDYLGIDVLPSMIERARERYAKARFEVGDLLARPKREAFDVVVCSGTLNVEVAGHRMWVRRMLSAMWERARLAVLVNFQWKRAFTSNPVSAYDDDIVHVERDAIIAEAERLTTWLTVRQDYLGDDIALYLYKDYHRSGRRLVRARHADPRDDAEWACGLAFLLLERKLPRQALDLLTDTENQVDKPNAMIHNYIGLCFHQLRDYRQAKKHYKLALTYNPQLEEARLNLDWIVKNA